MFIELLSLIQLITVLVTVINWVKDTSPYKQHFHSLIVTRRVQNFTLILFEKTYQNLFWYLDSLNQKVSAIDFIIAIEQNILLRCGNAEFED